MPAPTRDAMTPLAFALITAAALLLGLLAIAAIALLLLETRGAGRMQTRLLGRRHSHG